MITIPPIDGSLTGTDLTAAINQRLRDIQLALIDLPLSKKGDILGFDTKAARVPVGKDGEVLTADSKQKLGLRYAPGSGGAVGTVVSVALTMPVEFAVSDTVVGGAVSLAVTKANETANEVWAGPASGSPAPPAFRALVAADLPGGGGSVTSVALTMPGEFNVSGSPIIGAGTLSVTKSNELANAVYSGPSSGGLAVPTFRNLVPADLPVATSSTLGIVRPDNSTVTVTAGVLSAAGSGVGAVGAIGAFLYSGIPAYIDIPWNFQITGWSIIGYGASFGSASVEVWFLSGSAPPISPNIPTATNKISGSAPVAISSSGSAAGGSSAISTWSPTALTQWGTVGFNPLSLSSFTGLQVLLFGTKS